MIFLLVTERKTSKQANKYDLLISKEGFRSKLWVDMLFHIFRQTAAVVLVNFVVFGLVVFLHCNYIST